MSSDLNALLEMGFSKNRAERALYKTNNQGVQQAMDWLFSHEDDPDIDEPFQAPEGQILGKAASDSAAESMPDATHAQGESAGGDNSEQTEAKSLKCDECGKLLRTSDEVQVHAAKTQHTSFSESTEEVKPLTEEEKRVQLLRLQERLKQKRVEKEEMEKQEQINREKQRRVHGKDMVEAKQKIAELEIKKIAEERRREKLEDKMARQKVKEQIEKDKRERAAKFAKSSQQEAAAPAGVTASHSAASAPEAAPAEKKEYTETKLQIRLTSGQALTQTFAAKEPLSAVRLFVQMKGTDGNGSFSLMTSFPRKVFQSEDYDKPLSVLGLVPSAVLMVTKN